jgi:hypothetical protein
MSFTLPPLTLPSDIISKQMSILQPAGVDAGFLNTIFPISASPGLFSNPFAGPMAEFQSLMSQFQTAEAIGNTVGLGSVVSTMTGHMSDMQTMLCNIGTNIVPTNLPMSSALAAGVTAAAPSLPGISAQDAPCVGPFIQSLGVPSLGTIMNVSLSQYSLSQIMGTVSAANPLPLLNNYTSMLTNMTSGCTQLISTATSVLSGIVSSSIENLPGVITGGLTSIESTLGSAIGGPMTSFGGSMFGAMKDQMTSGLSIAMRHMCETNFALKFQLTGLGSTMGGGFTGILPSGVQSAIANFPSNVNAGHIIP